jgi:tetratricopeptide (TPR) repeat protein
LHAAYSYITWDKKRFLFVAFAFSTGALLSHESGVLLLPLIILVAYSKNFLARRATAIVLATITASDGLVLYVRYLVGAHGGGGHPAFISIGLAFWKYWAWMLLPIHMSIQRSLSTPAATYSPQAIVALSCLMAFCVAIALVRNSVPVVAAGLAWAIIAVLPYCGIIFIYQGMAERYLYLASPGIALAVAAAVEYKGKLSIAIRCIACLWIAWGISRLESRVREWADPVALYESSLQATPDPMLFYDLGWAWRERGDLQNALMAYKEAADRRPDYEEAQASIGQVLYLMGRPDQAIEPYLRALAIQPTDVNTRVDFALALAQVGRKQEAEQQFRQAIVSAPQNISALDGLGSLYLAQGSYGQALELFQSAIRYNPNDSTAYYNLAVIYQGIGDRRKAIEFYKKVLAINPNDGEALANIMKLERNR